MVTNSMSQKSRLLGVRLRRIVAVFALAAGVAEASPLSTAQSQTETSAIVECVVLLHGLGRTHRSMKPMADALQGAGYVSVNMDYPSRKQSIEALADSTIPEGVLRCRQKKAAVIHFVTHSMGGILVRYFLARDRIERLGRVVMLSPPNQGSEAADSLKDEPVYQWLNGPAGQQLSTSPDSLPLRLGPVDFPLGIITGDRAAFFDKWLADVIPGPNDGKVSVVRAQVAGMADFLVVPYTHTFIMEEPGVILQTLNFLRYGHFQHDRAGTEQEKGARR